MSRKLKYGSGTVKKSAWVIKTGEISKNERITGAHIEMISNREICIEGCVGVLEYTDAYMKINLCKGALIIIGSNLDITLFEGKTLAVCGTISSVEFCV